MHVLPYAVVITFPSTNNTEAGAVYSAEHWHHPCFALCTIQGVHYALRKVQMNAQI